jgi:hypothetical protein
VARKMKVLCRLPIINVLKPIGHLCTTRFAISEVLRSAHRVLLLVLYEPQNKRRLFP